ncbi:MAG: hypothetical protein NPIRA04_22610 [Nitrospirales bacterium]|nr:MAG: hypothetical protein NPIRA04_22610 [Nitrospirales bacterium]
MPSVFLSYASQDEAYAKSLEQGLTEHGITVWRDKTNLHAGERWPKRLGEAMADQNFFLLLWSHAAAQSDFVELEWNIAMAMRISKKPKFSFIVPMNLHLPEHGS